MKRLKYAGIFMFSLFLCFSLAGQCFGQYDTVLLDVPMYYTDASCNVWCWAATSQMLLAYHGSSYGQSTIANWAIQDVGKCRVNWLYGCGYDVDGVYKYGDDYIINNFGGLDSDYETAAIDTPSIYTQLSSYGPFAIRWDQSPNPGHHLVCTGIIFGFGGPWLALNDPASGAYTALASWVVSGSNHTWTHTLLNIQ